MTDRDAAIIKSASTHVLSMLDHYKEDWRDYSKHAVHQRLIYAERAIVKLCEAVEVLASYSK